MASGHAKSMLSTLSFPTRLKVANFQMADRDFLIEPDLQSKLGDKVSKFHQD